MSCHRVLKAWLHGLCGARLYARLVYIFRMWQLKYSVFYCDVQLHVPMQMFPVIRSRTPRLDKFFRTVQEKKTLNKVSSIVWNGLLLQKHVVSLHSKQKQLNKYCSFVVDMFVANQLHRLSCTSHLTARCLSISIQSCFKNKYTKRVTSTSFRFCCFTRYVDQVYTWQKHLLFSSKRASKRGPHKPWSQALTEMVYQRTKHSPEIIWFSR